MSKNFTALKSTLLTLLSQAEFELKCEHALDTLKWVKRMASQADEALQIAALAHDLERAVPPMIRRRVNEAHKDYKKRHAKRSALLIMDLMRKQGYSQPLWEKTGLLVENHEIGGDLETDILRDADSISFFSCNIDWYFHYKQGDLELLKKQIAYKYDRASPRARSLIKLIKIKNPVLSEACRNIFT